MEKVFAGSLLSVDWHHCKLHHWAAPHYCSGPALPVPSLQGLRCYWCPGSSSPSRPCTELRKTLPDLGQIHHDQQTFHRNQRKTWGYKSTKITTHHVRPHSPILVFLKRMWGIITEKLWLILVVGQILVQQEQDGVFVNNYVRNTDDRCMDQKTAWDLEANAHLFWNFWFPNLPNPKSTEKNRSFND